MIYLHESPLKYHGLLCTSNCLIDSRWVVKLSDFGLQAFKKGAEDPPNLQTMAAKCQSKWKEKKKRLQRFEYKRLRCVSSQLKLQINISWKLENRWFCQSFKVNNSHLKTEHWLIYVRFHIESHQSHWKCSKCLAFECFNKLMPFVCMNEFNQFVKRINYKRLKYWRFYN